MGMKDIVAQVKIINRNTLATLKKISSWSNGWIDHNKILIKVGRSLSKKTKNFFCLIKLMITLKK